MLEGLVVLLLVLWIVGMVTSYTVGGLAHLLLVLAVVLIVIRVVRGRQAL